MKALCWLLLVLSPPGFASTELGNGGDAILQEFNLRGLQLAAYFRSEAAAGNSYGIDPVQFLAVVKQTRLTAKDHLFLRGQEVDAINYPAEKRIEVSRTRWHATAGRLDAYFMQRRIALHEYLWIYGVNDDGYAISNPIIEAIERSAGNLLDPEVRRMLFQRFCNHLMGNDFPEAQKLLAWGLDLNAQCKSGMRPLEIVLLSYVKYSTVAPIESERLDLMRAMFVYGLNPNAIVFPSIPLAVAASAMPNLDLLQLIFEFGGDPNLLDSEGVSAFSQVANTTSPKGPALTVPIFQLFLANGGDVNLSENPYLIRSPARMIVSQSQWPDLVEALVASGRVDWCNRKDFYGRTYDRVLNEYIPLLEKHGVQCGPYRFVTGEASSCEEAQRLGRKRCQDEGFTLTELVLPEANPCMEGRQGQRIFFTAYFHCHNGH